MSGYAEWNNFTTYSVGDTVWYNGFTWVANNVNTNVPPYPPTADWSNTSPINPAVLTGYVKNPMESTLDSGAFNITNTNDIQTTSLGVETVALRTGSLAARITANDAFDFVSPTPTVFSTAAPRTNVAPTDPDDLTNKAYVDSVAGGSGVQNPMTANLQSGNFNIEMAEGNITFASTSAPTDYAINGVFNIDTGALPYPVMRFSSSKAGGTQQKSLTLEMSDGVATWSSQWEGYIPQEIRTQQAVYTIAGQGVGASTVIQSDVLTIGPNAGSATAGTYNGSLAFTGGASATNPPVAGIDLTNKTYVDGRTQRPTNVYYVAKNGSDSLGDGSIGKPFLTIQQAITTAEAGALPSASNRVVIFIAPGNYTENLTLTDGYTTLVGASNAPRVNNTRIIGTITIAAAGANDLYNRTFGFQNLLITPTGAGFAIIDSTASTEHSVVLTNVRITCNDRAFYQSFAGNSRNIISNCIITHENASALYTNPLVEIAGAGWLEMTLTELYAMNPQCDVLRFSGTSYPYRISLSSLTSASTSATANPIVRYSSTGTGIGSVGQCAFVYESATVKTANQPTSTGWLFDTGALAYPAYPIVQFLQNSYILNGLPAAGLFVIAKSGTTTGTPIIATGSQIAAPTLASKIQTGGAITHLPYSAVS